MPALVKRSEAVVRGRTLPDQIVEVLRSDIADGTFAPGAALRQEGLAERFGVSRIPIRDAIRRLQDEGLVTVFPNRGAFVVTLADHEIVEIFHLRRLLESDLLKQAIGRMTDDDLEAIQTSLMIAERGARGRDWSRLDGEFHRRLYEPAGRPRQLGMVTTLRTLVQDSDRNERLPAKTDQWLEHHREIFRACTQRDAAKANRLLLNHLRAAEGTLRTKGKDRKRTSTAKNGSA